MQYTLYCTKDYKMKWFPKGLSLDAAQRAPMLIFNRKDLMHGLLLADVLGEEPSRFNAFYLPSSERFAAVIASGRVCGMLPFEQARPLLERGDIVSLIPDTTFDVHLHWHCWNLDSPGLSGFTKALVTGGRSLLAQSPLPQTEQ